jgi:hypothetical protein
MEMIGMRIIGSAVCVIVILIVAAAAAEGARARTYSATQVKHGFAVVGDRVFDTGFSSFASPVTVLSTVAPRDGWTATLYVYPSIAKATASFAANHTGWRKQGFAAEQVKNLVVTIDWTSKAARSRGGAVVPVLVARALALAVAKR